MWNVGSSLAHASFLHDWQEGNLAAWQGSYTVQRRGDTRFMLPYTLENMQSRIKRARPEYFTKARKHKGAFIIHCTEWEKNNHTKFSNLLQLETWAWILNTHTHTHAHRNTQCLSVEITEISKQRKLSCLISQLSLTTETQTHTNNNVTN